MARLSSRAPRCLIFGLSLLVVALTAPAALAQPSIARLEPGALAPGQTVEVTLHGAKLDDPVKVWSSFPATWEVTAGEPDDKGRKSIKAKVTLDAAVPCGIGAIGVAAAGGASDLFLVPVDDLPSVGEAANNHELAAAQQVTLPVAVDGKSDGPVFDFFRFDAKAGQPISIEVLGARLGSDFDPVLRVLDATGDQVALADDDPALGADCRLRFTPPADGAYVLELRDNRYKAGGRYRLRIGDFPLVSTTFPLSAQLGQPASLTFAGPAAEGAESVALTAASEGQQPIGGKLPGGAASGLANVLVDDLPVAVEVQIADKPDEPTPVTLPCAINGKLEATADRDAYRFTLKKGERVRFQPLSRSLGSPALLQLRVLGPDGKQLAESPINENDEPALSLVAPADGDYQLVVQEIVGFGGPDYTYRVEARTGSSFALRQKYVAKQPAKLVFPASAGSARDLTVECVRDGYDGPITLSVESPRTGWQVYNNVIPAKGKEVRMFIVAPADLQPGEFVPLQIVGRADVGGREHVATMTATTHLREARPSMTYPPLWLDGQLAAGGIAPKPEFYKLTAKPEVFFPRLVGETKLTLTFDRTVDGYKDQPLTVIPLQTPPGLSVAEVKRNGNGKQDTYDIVLRGAKDLPEGKHTLKYFAYGEFAGLGQATVQELPVSVVTPLAVSIAPAGELIQGQPQKLKVTLVRAGDDKQPVEVKFKKLPTGVTGPESIKLEAEQAELEVELTTAADAPVGKFDDIAVTATTKYAGQDLAVDSPHVSLEVKAP